MGVGVVELLLERAHEAAPVGSESSHGTLLSAAQRRHLFVAFRVVGPPRSWDELPPGAISAHGPFNIENFQHGLDPAHAKVDRRHELPGRAPRLPGPLELVEHRHRPFARGKRLLDEEVLDAAVLLTAQEHDIGVLDGAAGAADLLVVGDDRARSLVVHDERQIGLVIPHAKRARGHHRLDVVAVQALLRGHALVAVLLTRVG